MARRHGKMNRPDMDDVDKIEPQTSEQAHREVELTRSRMSDTLNALEQKVEPRRLLDEISTTIKSMDFQGYVADLVKKNPVPLMLIGAGATWLVVDTLRSRSGPADDGTSPSAIAGIGQKASRMAGQVSDSLSGTARALGDKASGIMDSARQRTADLGSAVSKSVAGMTEQVRSASQQYLPDKDFSDILEGYPLAIAAGVVAAGVVAGMLIPVTRREREVMGEAADRLVSSAKETGLRAVQQTADVVTQKVSNVARSVADAAAERLNNDEPLLDKIKGMAQDAAHTAGEQMRKEGLLTDDSKEYGSISQDHKDSNSHKEKVKPSSAAVPAPASMPHMDRSFESAKKPGDALPSSIPGPFGGQIGDHTTDHPEAGVIQPDKNKQDKHQKP